MNDERRVLPEAWSSQIDTYLDSVERAMMSTDATRASRRSVVEMVEDQITEMCQTKLSDDSTDDDFRTLFEQLDKPESFAGEFEGVSAADVLEVESVPPKPTWSKRAILATALPILAVLAYFGAIADEGGEVSVTVLVAFCIGALFAPLVGWFALKKIEQSDVEIKGRKLALFGIYAPILLVANALAIGVSAVFPPLPIVIGAILLLGILNWFLVKWIRTGISRAKKPSKPRENKVKMPNGVAPA